MAWLAHIAAQKANTANAFSLPKLSLSTANLYAAVQPGGTLYGLQHSNPVDTGSAYRGPHRDSVRPMIPCWKPRGRHHNSAGGLALYAKGKILLGAIWASVAIPPAPTTHCLAHPPRPQLDFFRAASE